jgi:prevent-host-death family protein
MRTMSATEASRGFSDLLDAVERGETVTVTRGGHVVAEIRPAGHRIGRDLRIALEARGPRLTEEDAEEMTRSIEESRAPLRPYDEDPWADD